MPPAEVEPTISADKRPQTRALDRAATLIGTHIGVVKLNESAGIRILISNHGQY